MAIKHVKLTIATSLESSKICACTCPHIRYHEENLAEWYTCELFARTGKEHADHKSPVPNFLEPIERDGGPVQRLPACLRAEVSE